LSHFLQLLLLLTLVISAAKIAGALAARAGQPAVFGEILAGLLLGPTILNVLGWSVFAARPEGSVIESAALLPVLRDIAEIGVVLLMFVAGLETDVAELRRVGRVPSGRPSEASSCR
jgi:Kef-type K+ transport system membrane component KefB